MKKLLLYSLFVIVALGSFTASGLTLTVNVDDPERLTLDIDYETQQLIKGDNVFEDIANFSSISITAKDDCMLRSVTRKSNGEELGISNYKSASATASSYSGWDGETLTVVTAKIDDMRTESCTVNIDDASLVTIDLKETSSKIQDLKNGENQIAYIPGIEKTLRIYSSKGGSYPIYKVEIGGTEAAPTGTIYNIALPAEGSIDITAAFPDKDCALTFEYSSDEAKGIITKVTQEKTDGDVLDITSGAASVKCGSVVYLHADLGTYKLSEFKINDKEATLTASTRMIVTDDTKVYIDARRYRDYTVKVTVDDPANVIAAYGKAVSTGTTFELTEGENLVTVNENANQLAFADSHTGYITELLYNGEAVSKNYTDSYPVNAEEGSEIVITSKKIERDLKAMVYITEDLSAVSDGRFFSAKLGNGSLVAGYNAVEFGEIDNPFTFQHGFMAKAMVYHNGNEVTPSGFTTKSYEMTLADGDVVKIFAGATSEPEKHAITFGGPALDDVSVVADKITPISEFDAPMSVMTGTHIDITPAQGKTVTVKADNEPVDAGIDGVYRIVADADKHITVDSTSGISEIDAAEAETGNVYNIAGICVLRNADAAAISSLPAGIYIFNGRKIAIK